MTRMTVEHGTAPWSEGISWRAWARRSEGDVTLKYLETGPHYLRCLAKISAWKLARKLRRG